MLAWLRGPGASASEGEFVNMLRAYDWLIEAVSMLPRGPALLKQFRATVSPRKQWEPTTTRDADSFTPDELALLPEAVLTPTGWVVQAPLLQQVDRVRAELENQNLPSGDQHALAKILERAARASGKRSNASLGSLKTKLSRQRTILRERQPAITAISKKVPPSRERM